MNLELFTLIISIVFIVFFLLAVALWVAEGCLDTWLARHGYNADGSVESPIIPSEFWTAPAAGEPAAEEPVEQFPTVSEEVASVQPLNEEEAETLADDGIAAMDDEAPLLSITENSVVFERVHAQGLTFAEKYAELPNEVKNRYLKVCDHILATQGCRRIESNSAVVFKYKTQKIMRAVIKRDIPSLDFMIGNPELTRHVKEEGVKEIKIRPVTIRLEDDGDVEAAIRTADLTVEYVKGELAYRKEKKRVQRNERRNSKNNNN